MQNTLASLILFKTKWQNGISYRRPINCFFDNQESSGSLRLDKLFILMNTKEPFHIYMQQDIKFKKLKETIVKNLKDFYKKDVDEQHIKFYLIEEEYYQNYKITEWIKKQEINEAKIYDYLKLKQKNVIGFEVIEQDTAELIKKIDNREFIIIKLDQQHNYRFKLSQIQKLTIRQLFLDIQIQDAENFGLKIINQIFKPCQFISEIVQYFNQCEGQYIRNIKCTLIDEREMFYREMGNFKEDYVIEKALVTHSKQHQYEKCRQLARKRIEQQQIRDKFIFKCAQEISPIAFYTSSVQVIDGNSSVLLSKSLKQNLRQNKFGMVKIDYQKDWKYKFTATLNRSLLKLKEYSPTEFKTFYRGVKGHILKCEEGQIYVEKQYASTTLNLQKAENWIKNSPAATLITILAKSGRLIQDFSLYKSQQQVLFMPYTYFEVIKKKLITKDKINRLQVTFRQLEISQYKSNPASYILWIDDNPKAGQKIIGSLDIPMQTTLFYQLKSNKQLREWINNNKQIINSYYIKIGVIANMRRVQEGIEVKAAGIETISLLKQFIPQSWLILYVNYMTIAKTRLVENGFNPESIFVTMQKKEVLRFISYITQPIENQNKLMQPDVQKKKREFFQKYTNFHYNKSHFQLLNNNVYAQIYELQNITQFVSRINRNRFHIPLKVSINLIICVLISQSQNLVSAIFFSSIFHSNNHHSQALLQTNLQDSFPQFYKMKCQTVPFDQSTYFSHQLPYNF